MGRGKRGLSLILVCLVGGCASTAPPPGLQITTTTPGGGGEQIPAMLSRPDGPGPFPAVVIMHDCSGLGAGSGGAPGRWAAELVERGYVVVLPDSFKTRGWPSGVCMEGSPGRADVSPLRRTYDARAALAYLRTLPFVDARRIGLMGGSHGGTTTLNTMLLSGFAAAVALYPRCAPRGVYRPTGPVLILIGEKDDWTPAEPCRRLAEAAQAGRQPVSIKIYPGAHHSFDSPFRERYVAARINPAAPGGRGATTGGNPAAWADSKKEVARFFAAHLR
jgi:dienelactone hydrolase